MNIHACPGVLTFLSCLTLAVAVRADNVTGRVVNTVGQGVAGVTLQFSGFTPLNPVTAPDGSFNIVVPAGTYDIGFLPPTKSLAPVKLEDVVVSGTINLGVITLRPGFTLTGTVTDTAGMPVFNADTDVFEQATRNKLFTPDDNTNALGVFEVVVPAGTYRVRIKPKKTDLLVADEVENVAVAGPIFVGTIVLQPGVLVSGTVLDAQSGVPLVNVDIDADDAQTGAGIVTPGDNTGALGGYSLVLPTGLFHLSYEPPQGMLRVARQVFNISVTGTTNLGVTTLEAGFLLSGRVLGLAATPVARADIDVDTFPGGVRILTSHDSTDATGNFAVVVPAGRYRVTVEPPFAFGLVGARTAPVTITGTIALPTFNLAAGVVLSGTITAFGGSPEARADLDVIDPSTGEELVTPGDDTNAQGRFATVVPKGTWDVTIQTRKGSLSRRQGVAGVAVAGPTTFDRRLTLVPIWTFLGTIGIPTVGQGGPVIAILGIFNPTSVTQQTNASLALLDPAGGETLLLPKIPLSLPPGLGDVVVAGFALPPVNPAHLGQPFRLEVRFDDSATGEEFDRDRFKFIIQ